MSRFLIIGNSGSQCWSVLNWHNVRNKFRENPPAGSKDEVRTTPVHPAWWSCQPGFTFLLSEEER